MSDLGEVSTRRRILPTMPVHLPTGWMAQVQDGGPVRITLAPGVTG